MLWLKYIIQINIYISNPPVKMQSLCSIQLSGSVLNM